jgi:hypothetical protein
MRIPKRGLVVLGDWTAELLFHSKDVLVAAGCCSCQLTSPTKLSRGHLLCLPCEQPHQTSPTLSAHRPDTTPDRIAATALPHRYVRVTAMAVGRCTRFTVLQRERRRVDTVRAGKEAHPPPVSASSTPTTTWPGAVH